MRFKSIRAQLSIHLIVLLFSGMMLISLTALLSFQNLSSSYMAKHYELLFESALNKMSAVDKNPNFLIMIKNIFEEMRESGVCSIKVIDKNKIKYEYGFCRFSGGDADKVLDSAFTKKRLTAEFITEGLYLPFFSENTRNYVVAKPLFDSLGSYKHTIAIIWDLESLYFNISRVERLIILYIIINTLVLSAVGVYQIGNITARPLKKILKKTSSVNIDDISLKGDVGSDFDKLSASITIIVDDLTEKRKSLYKTVKELESANSDLRRIQKDIIRAEKMASIGRLSAGLAHEIGNPVSIISGYLEMLKQKDIDDIIRIDFASRAEDELNRIDSIIRELLDYARPSDQGKTVLSVHRLINDIVRAFAGSRAIGNIYLKTDLDAAFDNVIANSDQLRQVFMNLIINASDAIFDSENRNNGQLTIATVNTNSDEVDPSDMIISIIDNGCGLSANDLENIFDPFFTTKPQGKGTGLGLSVSMMIIEDIGGSINAYSRDDLGTEFRIILPLAKEVINI